MNRIMSLLLILVVPLIMHANRASAMEDDYFSNATAKLADGDYQGAFEDYSKAIKLKSNYAEAYNGRATTRTGIGDHDGAIADYTEAIKLKSKYAEAIYGRANARFIYKHDYRGAIADYDTLLKLKPDTPLMISSVPLVRVYFSRAMARESASEAMTDPKRRQREMDPAIADVTTAIELFEADPGGGVASRHDICGGCGPGNSESLEGAFVKRCMLKNNIGDSEGAIGDCTKAINLDPKDSLAWGFRALARRKMGDMSGAVEDCAKTVSISLYERQRICKGILQ